MLMGGYVDELSQVVITQHRPQAAHLSVRAMIIVKVKITNVHSNAARIGNNSNRTQQQTPPPPTPTHTHILFEVQRSLVVFPSAEKPLQKQGATAIQEDSADYCASTSSLTMEIKAVVLCNTLDCLGV